MVTIHPPSLPYRGLRVTDAFGSGAFGASRDGGKRIHLGQDYLALPGDIAQASIGGIITRVGWPYPNWPELELVEIQGDGAFSGYRQRLLYVKLTARVGDAVNAGVQIGVVGDVEAYYAVKFAGREMTNHVHLELIAHVDPQRYMRNGAAIHT